MTEMQPDRRGAESPARASWQPWVVPPVIGVIVVGAGSYVAIVLVIAIVMLTTIALVAIFCTPKESRGARAERIFKAVLRWRSTRSRRDRPS